MRICLVWPDTVFAEDPMVYPPLGLWILWTLLEAKGHTVAYRDLAEDELPLTGFDAYLVSGTSPQAHDIRRIGGILRKNTLRGILGGSHATVRGRECLDYGFEVVIAGEVDDTKTLDEILSAPKGTFLTMDRPKELEHIVLPTRKVAWRYRSVIQDLNGAKKPATSIFTSRGCPFRCAFCETVKIWGRNVRWTPFETVKREIEEIVNLGFTGIMFYDDIFPLNKTRTLKILEVLKHYHKRDGLIWRCLLRTDIIIQKDGQEYLQQMYDAGLREVIVGVESGSNVIKENIHKKTRIEQDTLVLKWCKEIGIIFKAAIVLGLPGETMETMEASRRWILENRPHRIDINTYIPFPGSPITDSIESNLDEYDIYWDDNIVTEEFWYKGKGQQRLSESLTGTSHLTPEEIGAFQRKLSAEIKDMPY